MSDHAGGLADLGRIELLVWDGQPVAIRLAESAHHVHRITRPTGTPAEDTAESAQPDPTRTHQLPTVAHRDRNQLAERLLTAVLTGLGTALGHRLLDTLLPRRRR